MIQRHFLFLPNYGKCDRPFGFLWNTTSYASEYFKFVKFVWIS